MTGQRTVRKFVVCLKTVFVVVKLEPIPPLSSVIGQVAQVDLALRHPPDTSALSENWELKIYRSQDQQYIFIMY